jgi:hypothetical protein
MDSIKDIISNLKKEREQKKEKPAEQEELFDTDKLETNPKRTFGDKHKYISTEHQMYGLRLSSKLGDKERATMYIKWAKEKPRAILETALRFTVDYPNAKDRSRIFMWKVKELEEEYEKKKKAKKQKS